MWQVQIDEHQHLIANLMRNRRQRVFFSLQLMFPSRQPGGLDSLQCTWKGTLKQTRWRWSGPAPSLILGGLMGTTHLKWYCTVSVGVGGMGGVHRHWMQKSAWGLRFQPRTEEPHWLPSLSSEGKATSQGVWPWGSMKPNPRDSVAHGARWSYWGQLGAPSGRQRGAKQLTEHKGYEPSTGNDQGYSEHEMAENDREKMEKCWGSRESKTSKWELVNWLL